MRIPKSPQKQYKDKRPKINGYLRIGSLYVSLAFTASLLTAFFAFGVLYMTAFHPVAMALWYERQNMPEFSIDSPYLAGYTGKARLFLPDGSLLYEGDVGGTAANGNGKLYQNGFLLYDGGFLENLYNGRGILYAPDGSVIYTGDFADNLYHGFGTLYFKLGKDNYSYTGSFDMGARSGEGMLRRNNAMIYEGGFKDNMRNGLGREYVYGKLRYEGSFLRDAYEGDGKLFDGNARLIYEGSFSLGKYGGDGTEYDPKTGYPVFQGKYLDGSRMEAGIEYGAHGTPIFDALSNPNPLDLMDHTYMDALSVLSGNLAACREQSIDGHRLIIDEASGVIYAFSLNEAGEPKTLSEIYLCGLASAGGLVVGSEIGDMAELTAQIPYIREGELFALSLSNAFWGKETREDELVSVALESGGLAVTAFCEAIDETLYSPDMFDGDLPGELPDGKLAKVLPGDPPTDAPSKKLPGDTSQMKAGRIVFLKTSQSAPDKDSLSAKE